ncbi:hypothetical protein ACI79C_24555 [Geodermatophilus sp. SYSU D00697]
MTLLRPESLRLPLPRSARRRVAGRSTGLLERARTVLSPDDPGAWDPEVDGDLLDWLGFSPTER